MLKSISEIQIKVGGLDAYWNKGIYLNKYGTQSFPIASDRPDMSGQTEVGPAKYPTTSDLQSGYFLGQVCFFGHFK